MTTMALPLYREVAAVAGWHYSVAQVVPILPTCHTLVLLALHVVVIHAMLLVTSFVHECELDGGRIVTDTLCQAPVLQITLSVAQS